MKQGSNNMGTFAFLMFCAAIFAAMGIWHYSQSEDTAFHKTLGLCRSCEADVKRHEEKLKKYDEDFKALNARLDAAEAEVKKFTEQLDIFRDQVSDTREKQIQLKDDLSNKTQRLVMPKGPIPVEIYVAPTVRATAPKQQAPPKIPKETPQQTMKKIKKQIDGLSK
jgi:hypothetical protein